MGKVDRIYNQFLIERVMKNWIGNSQIWCNAVQFLKGWKLSNQDNTFPQSLHQPSTKIFYWLQRKFKFPCSSLSDKAPEIFNIHSNIKNLINQNQKIDRQELIVTKNKSRDSFVNWTANLIKTASSYTHRKLARKPKKLNVWAQIDVIYLLFSFQVY